MLRLICMLNNRVTVCFLQLWQEIIESDQPIKLEIINATKMLAVLSEGRPDWACQSTIMIHFKQLSKRVFILGTVKQAHLINYIIPAMVSTRSKPLFNCFRAHVHASTRCLLSKKAPFQQQLRNGWPWTTPSHWLSLQSSTLFCVSNDQAHQTRSKYLAPHISAATVTEVATWNSIIQVSSFKFWVCWHHPRPGPFLQ